MRKVCIPNVVVIEVHVVLTDQAEAYTPRYAVGFCLICEDIMYLNHHPVGIADLAIV